MNLKELSEHPAWEDVDQLVELMKIWSDAYYNEGYSPVSDPVYDAAKKQLELLDAHHPYLAMVGAPTNSKGEERHKIPMGSLNNVNNEDEFRDWWAKTQPGEVLVQYKYDGLSLGLEYQDGKLVRGLTRGDGIFGENQTKNISNCYHADRINTLKAAFTGSIRGEGIIHRADFNEQNFPGESNPRNSAVGAIRKSNSSRAQWVRLACYDLANNNEHATEESKLQFMAELGLPVCKYHKCNNPDDVISIYNKVEAKRDELPFAVDGLVIKTNDISRQKKLGSHKSRPKHSIAFKFTTMKAETTLRNIILTIGCHGSIIPTAEYDPVIIEGRTFQHALLDNFDTIEKHQLGIGDRIEIEITGDIIPKLRRVIDHSRNVYPRPTECPVCGAPVAIDGAKTLCASDNCPGKSIAKINHWIKKTGIKYLGESRQRKLFEAGIVTTPADLYTVTREELGQVIGDGNAAHVTKEIDRCRTLPLHIFIGSLGVPFLGRSNAKKLIVAGINTLEKFQNMNPEELDIPGFNINLIKIANGIKNNQSLIDDLINAGVFIQEEILAPQTNNDAPTFCFTGIRLGAHKAKFDGKGWIEKSSVSKKLDYLVAKDPTSGSTKIKKAKKYGIEIISWAEFVDMLNA